MRPHHTTEALRECRVTGRCNFKELHVIVGDYFSKHAISLYVAWRAGRSDEKGGRRAVTNQRYHGRVGTRHIDDWLVGRGLAAKEEAAAAAAAAYWSDADTQVATAAAKLGSRPLYVMSRLLVASAIDTNRRRLTSHSLTNAIRDAELA